MQADLAALTERVRRRMIRWFRLTHLLDAAAAADMLAWENSGFSIAASVRNLVPPPRKHRHRYHGVFAPNHKLRRAVTALAIGNIGKRREAVTGGCAAGGRDTGGCCDANPNQKPRSHDTSRIAWAKLMARVGEEFPLECPNCGGDIRLSFKLRPTSCPGSISTASERCRTRPTHVGKLRTGTRSAPTREKSHRSGCGAFRENRSGRPGRSSRGSRVAHQPEDR
jgi:hypothetical protein